MEATLARPRFHTRSGLLTGYALACGYVERECGVTLWHEYGVYHVRGPREWSPIDGLSHEWIGGWHTFERVADARKAFRATIATVKAKDGSA